MAFEALPATGAGSAEAGRVVRASWGEQVRLNFDDHEERIQDLEAITAAVWRGDWAVDTAYNAGDIVQHNGSSWRASEDIPIQSPDIEPGETSPDPWTLVAAAAVQDVTRTIGITIDGSGSDITTGIKGYVRVPFSGTIVRATLLSSDEGASPASGDVVIDVLKDIFANYPPTTSICASAKPRLTNDQTYEDATLTGWDTTVTAGDVFGFEVESASGVTRATLILDVET
jgi:hypothetical protein